jgi:flagellar motor switch protein FliM
MLASNATRAPARASRSTDAGGTGLNLQAGSVVPIDAASDGSLLVRVAGRPKFRAIRGALGQRLAVQLTERIAGGEVRDGGRG